MQPIIGVMINGVRLAPSTSSAYWVSGSCKRAEGVGLAMATAATAQCTRSNAAALVLVPVMEVLPCSSQVYAVRSGSARI